MSNNNSDDNIRFEYHVTLWLSVIFFFILWLKGFERATSTAVVTFSSILFWAIIFDNYRIQKKRLKKEELALSEDMLKPMLRYRRMHRLVLFIIIAGASLTITYRLHVIPASWVIDYQLEDTEVAVGLMAQEIAWVDSQSFINRGGLNYKPKANTGLYLWNMSSKTLSPILSERINKKLYIHEFCFEPRSKKFAFITSSHEEIYGGTLDNWALLKQDNNYDLTIFDCRILEDRFFCNANNSCLLYPLREEHGYLEKWKGSMAKYDLIQDNNVVLKDIPASRLFNLWSVDYLSFLNAYNIHRPTVKWVKSPDHNSSHQPIDWDKYLFLKENCFRNTLIYPSIPKVEHDCIPGSKFAWLKKPHAILRTKNALVVRFDERGLFVYKRRFNSLVQQVDQFPRIPD